MQRGTPWLALGASALLGCWLLVLGACQQEAPDRWAEAQQQSSQNPTAVSSQAVAGGEFNRFFPQVQAPWDIVFKQEKTGFAQASLQHQGREVAVLSISDTRNNPEALEKFQQPAKTVAGRPLAAVGEDGTAVLVNDRFQVQIRSLDPSIGPDQRDEWLGKFDLESIGRID